MYGPPPSWSAPQRRSGSSSTGWAPSAVPQTEARISNGSSAPERRMNDVNGRYNAGPANSCESTTASCRGAIVSNRTAATRPSGLSALQISGRGVGCQVGDHFLSGGFDGTFPFRGGKSPGELFALPGEDRKSTRLNSSHLGISYA